MVRQLITERGSISTGDLVEATGLTRQAVHFHLRDLVAREEIERRGSGRGAHYLLATPFDETYPIEGLEEDRVWRQITERVPDLERLHPGPRSILHYALTEMLNNAIDHSASDDVRVRVWTNDERVAFGVRDRGVGVFAHVRRRLGLADDLDALEALSKGKTTTDPDRHTGEGIFFTSKALDLFVLEGNGLRWTVDNARKDQAAGEVPDSPGTLVRCEIEPGASRSLREVFDQYAAGEEPAFSRSRVAVRLFERGDRFVSRSEAKRLAEGLDRFEEVLLDFTGVREIGQGFADELFRVWSRDHPRTRLIALNSVAPVQRMIDRALGRGG